MTPTRTPSLDFNSLMMLIALAAVWGGTFFFAEIALQEVPPFTITLIRVALAIPFLAVIVLKKAIPIPRSPRSWSAYLVMGALNNAIPFSLIFWGQTQIESGLAAILNATTAMFAAVVAGIFLKDEPLTVKKMLGAILGIFGVAFIMGPSVLTDFDPRNLAQLAVLCASLSYAFAGVWGKTTLSTQPALMNALGMLIGTAIIMIPIVLIYDGVPSFALSVDVWGALISMAVLSTAMAYVLYFSILSRVGAANMLLVTLLIPPFAIALGVMFLNETINTQTWTGFAIIALGFAVTDGRIFAQLSKHA
jgi:drug/metabolite transporter (DMT)-like permease